MTSFLLYIARGGLYLGLFYAFFLLVMRKTTFFRLNRILLLAGVMFFCNPAKAITAPAKEIPQEADPGEDEWGSSPVTWVLFSRMPSFNGGSPDGFTRWVDSQLQELKQRVSVEGSVLVQFTVGADGAVGDVRVVSGLRKDLDEAVVRTVSASPRWTPAVSNEGKTVPVDYAVSVNF